MLRHLAAGLCPALALCAALFASPGAQAQSTDGYHAVQVLPVVVDTASFTQRITLRNPQQLTVNITGTYYPADGTTQSAPIECPAVAVAAVSSVTVAGLRAMCPDLAAGSQFGTLVLRTGKSWPFAVYSRVSNAAGAGFSVEGFPAFTFTSARTVVTGLRRLAASASGPAYQTNCFMGNLGEFAGGPNPESTSINVKLLQDKILLGQTTVSLPPGRLVRLLDVFNAVGAVAGDHDDVTAIFSTTASIRPALLAFCTVQDNTSFGADFRIAKVEAGKAGLVSQDYIATRASVPFGDFKFIGEADVRRFVIPAGSSRNVHLYYFRHPDVISCDIYNPQTVLPATESYGLELRLLALTASGDWEPIAGGSNVSSFSDFYLGDKIQRGAGSNTRYLLEVESNGSNEGVDRPYWLACASGSGTTLGEMVLTGAPVSF